MVWGYRPRIGVRTRGSRILSRLAVLATLLYALALLGVWWLTTRVGEWWWISTVMLYLPRLVYALPLAPLMLLAVVTERRLLPVQFACLLFLLGPLMGWHAPGRGEVPPAGAAPIRVLTYNIGARAPGAAALLQAVAENSPDIVVAQEASNLSALFPGWTTHHAGEYFLASRFPLIETEDRPLLPEIPWRRGVRYRLEGPRGPLTLFSLHLDTPRQALEELKAPQKWRLIRWRNLPAARRALAEDARHRSREAAAAHAWVRSAGGPCIIAGDFNSPPDSLLCRAHWGSYRDAFAVAGSGYGFTAHAPHPWVRIDRILLTPEWGVSRAWIARGSGRDHLPVVAEVWQR
jgi:endonuclease/exonuclease/phosphatase (EEP) superfamily protein YafD